MSSHNLSLLIMAAVLVGSPTAARAQDNGPLTIADLSAYRTAIDPNNGGRTRGFREFSRALGHTGRVSGATRSREGRVVTVFHKGAAGQFPALAEVWLFNPESETTCIVFAETPDHPSPKMGTIVEFSGTFLRVVRYRGGDVDRLAPLIVGTEPPRMEKPSADVLTSINSPFDTVAILLIGGIVVLALVRVAMRPSNQS